MSRTKDAGLPLMSDEALTSVQNDRSTVIMRLIYIKGCQPISRTLTNGSLSLI